MFVHYMYTEHGAETVHDRHFEFWEEGGKSRRAVTPTGKKGSQAEGNELSLFPGRKIILFVK